MTATQWQIVDDDRDGVVVHISDAGHAALAAEQREEPAARDCTQIRIAVIAASIVAIACLMAKHLLG